MWLVGSGVFAPVRGDLVKLRAVSTNARHGLRGALGEVDHRTRVCLGQMLNRKNSGFVTRA